MRSKTLRRTSQFLALLSVDSFSIQQCLSNCHLFSFLVTSIHAPHAGCDRAILLSFHFLSHFNSRAPCGGRQLLVLKCQIFSRLQSTHPIRGATDYCTHHCSEVHNYFNPRTPCGGRHNAEGLDVPLFVTSIHAPTRGATIPGRSRCASIYILQFTHPMRGATDKLDLYTLSVTLQFTHPMQGGTLPAFVLPKQTDTSIHAPRMGGDCEKRHHP